MRLLVALLLAAAPASAEYAAVHGLKMYYEVHGNGPPLVLLHGGTGSIENFRKNIPDLSKGHRVFAVEQMGHGRTADDPKRAFHYHDMAEDTVELLKQLKIESAIFVGWSDGGVVGLDLAMHHPALVKKLVISGANASPSGTATLDAHAVKWLREVKPEEWPFRDAYVRLSPDGAAHFPAFLGRLKTMWLSEPSWTREQLATIKSPTLVVAGDHDMVLLRHTVDIFEAIPGAELWIAPNSGHDVPKARATQFNETMAAFFKEAPKRE